MGNDLAQFRVTTSPSTLAYVNYPVWNWWRLQSLVNFRRVCFSLFWSVLSFSLKLSGYDTNDEPVKDESVNIDAVCLATFDELTWSWGTAADSYRRFPEDLAEVGPLAESCRIEEAFFGFFGGDLKTKENKCISIWLLTCWDLQMSEYE